MFPYILPDWRILAHYTAAITGFGLLPAPVATAISPVSSPPVNVIHRTPSPAATGTDPGYQTTPDGLHYDGCYGDSGNNPASYSYSLVATANAGSLQFRPVSQGDRVRHRAGHQLPAPGASTTRWGYALWLSWTGVAPSFNVYSSASAATEKLLRPSSPTAPR